MLVPLIRFKICEVKRRLQLADCGDLFKKQLIFVVDVVVDVDNSGLSTCSRAHVCSDESQNRPKCIGSP